MASVNKVILIGNLGRDPETRYSADGAAITNITIATTDRWKDKGSGEMKEQTEWHRVAFFGRLAEIAGEYLRKGRPVYVEGRLRTRKWTDKEGQERYARREMCWTYLLEEALPWLGRTLIGHIGVQLKRQDKFPKISCHATSLGDANHVNLPDVPVRVVQITPTVNSISPLPVLVEMNGRLSLPCSWQLGETPVAAVDDFHRRFDQVLARMVAEVLPQGVAA